MLEPVDTNTAGSPLATTKTKSGPTIDLGQLSSPTLGFANSPTVGGGKSEPPPSTPGGSLKTGVYDLSKLDMSQAEAPTEHDLTTLPLAERLASTDWKHRVHGYQELTATFQNAGPSTEPFNANVSTLLHALKTEKLTKAICEAMELLRAFVEFAPAPSCLEQLGGTEALLVQIIKLTFTQNKLCLNKAFQTIFMLIEKTEEGGTIVAETLSSYFTQKQKFKIAVAAASCLRESIALFGCGKTSVPFQPIAKTLTLLFEHTSKSVRSEAERLVVEMTAWMKSSAVFNFTALKEIQQKSIQSACDKEMKQGRHRTPTKWTPKTLRTKEASDTTSNKENGPRTGETKDSTGNSFVSSTIPTTTTSTTSSTSSTSSSSSLVLDTNDELWEQLPAISFTPVLDKTNFYTTLKESKWALRKEGWDKAIQLCGNGSTLFRLEKDNYGDIFRAIKATLNNDSNMKVRISALQLTGKIASGGRKNVVKHCSSLLSTLLLLFKEKHKTHKMAVDHCIDQVFVYCIPDLNDVFSSCMSVAAVKGESKTGALHDSNPLVRTCKWKRKNNNNKIFRISLDKFF